MRQGLSRRTPTKSGNRRSGMNTSELRRKLRAFQSGGLFFRLLTR
jgi:hypothetical protein